jgi:hypothetical protein
MGRGVSVKAVNVALQDPVAWLLASIWGRNGPKLAVEIVGQRGFNTQKSRRFFLMKSIFRSGSVFLL